MNREKKQYDFTKLNEFFNEWESPKQLSEELSQMIFNYAALIDEYSVDSFKKDLSVVCTFRDVLDSIS